MPSSPAKRAHLARIARLGALARHGAGAQELAIERARLGRAQLRAALRAALEAYLADPEDVAVGAAALACLRALDAGDTAP